MKISDDYLPKDEATFLVFNVVQLLTKKSEQIENAKVAVIMLMAKFAEKGYFTSKECTLFMESSFDSFLKGALFKIKKQMLPAMLAIKEHLDSAEWKKKILDTFMEYTQDGIWGVRRVCMDLLPEFI